MSGFSTDKNRKVIPRWRSFDKTLGLKELRSVTPPRTHQKVTADFMTPKIMDWLKNQTIGHAADLVGAALTLGREGEAIGAAKFLLQEGSNSSPWARELAKRVLKIPDTTETVLGPKSVKDLYVQVKIYRDLLRTEPKDPIIWVELSRVYACLGLGKKAGRCMTIALQLATNNRFILRSASRLWIHLDDPEKAHHIIFKADRTRYDPWLLAAEIAIGSIAEKTPRYIKDARRMLSEGKLSPNHISELASALATLELDSGSIKKSKKLFVRSLEDPTENSIAQIAWASRGHSSRISFNEQHLQLHNAFEAKFWAYYQKRQWKQSVEQCKQWQDDQMFSSWPSMHGSYVSAVALEDYQTSESFAKHGLRANQKDFTLLNNLAFSRINLDDTTGAKEVLSKIDRLQLSDRNRIVLQATRGLFEFRAGNVVGGHKLYLEARLKAGKLQDSDGRRLLALASVFHAIEVVSQEVSKSGLVLSEALQLLKQIRDDDPIYNVLEDRLTKIKSGFRTRPN